MGGDRRRRGGFGGRDLVPSRTHLRLIVAVVFVLLGLAPAAGASTHHAGVVVNDGRHTVTRCVAFTGRSTTGLAALQKTGFATDISTSSLGSAVCSMNGTGCSSRTNCFCHYPTFWRYWTLDPGQKKWKFSDIGAQARRLVDGALDAWVWEGDRGPPPKVTSVDAICSAAGPALKHTQDKNNYWAFGGFVLVFAVAATILAKRRSSSRR